MFENNGGSCYGGDGGCNYALFFSFYYVCVSLNN